jgi:hypothetical protein
MGYACPVCETPQQDAEHLANHLAFTAMIHGDDHESWLDERVPDWSDRSPDELAPAVVEYVPETEYDAVFEDTAEDGHGGDAVAHDHEHEHARDHARDIAGRGRSHTSHGGSGDDLDPETREVLAEARDLTRQMLDEGGEADDGDEGGEADGDDTGGDDIDGDDTGGE